MWGINISGTREQILEALPLTRQQGEPNEEEGQISFIDSALVLLARRMTNDQQIIISASGQMVGERGELRLVVTFVPM